MKIGYIQLKGKQFNPKHKYNIQARYQPVTYRLCSQCGKRHYKSKSIVFDNNLKRVSFEEMTNIQFHCCSDAIIKEIQTDEFLVISIYSKDKMINLSDIGRYLFGQKLIVTRERYGRQVYAAFLNTKTSLTTKLNIDNSVFKAKMIPFTIQQLKDEYELRQRAKGLYKI